MKKLLIVLLFILVVSLSYAQDVEYADVVGQITVLWDATPPIEPTDIITYQLFIDSITTGEVMVGETDLLIFTITFIPEDEYKIGVNTKREIHTPSFTETVYSDINWSDVDIPIGNTPIPFVVRFLKGMISPVNLRIE